jgi:hypothetical protein
MTSPKKLPDIRMVEREQRRQGARVEVPRDPANFPDLAANVLSPSDEELEKLRAELETEREVRNRRIERFIKEGPLKPVPRAVIPVSENDL